MILENALKGIITTIINQINMMHSQINNDLNLLNQVYWEVPVVDRIDKNLVLPHLQYQEQEIQQIYFNCTFFFILCFIN